MVLDSHTHAWGPDTPANPWVNEAFIDRVKELPVASAYTAEELLKDMDATGIKEAVVVGYPIVKWIDNAYTIEAVSDHDRLHGVGLIDPFANDAGATLRTIMAEDGMVGVRLGALFPPDQMWRAADPSTTWLRDAIQQDDFWTAAAETGAAVHFLIHYDQLGQVVDLVDAYPDVTYVIDHLARVDVSESPDVGGFATMTDLAEKPSVLVKASAAPYLSTSSFPFEDIHNHVQWILDHFGRERVAWGSDWPNVSDMTDTYTNTLDWLEHVNGLSTADRNWLTGRSLRRHLDHL